MALTEEVQRYMTDDELALHDARYVDVDTFRRILRELAKTRMERNELDESLARVRAENAAKDATIAELRAILKHLLWHHERVIETGRERIIELGGDCDSPDKLLDTHFVTEARGILERTAPK